MEEQFLQAISTVGFPAAMCFYFMTRTEKTLDALRATVEQNTIVTRELIVKLSKDGDAA